MPTPICLERCASSCNRTLLSLFLHLHSAQILNTFAFSLTPSGRLSSNKRIQPNRGNRRFLFGWLRRPPFACSSLPPLPRISRLAAPLHSTRHPTRSPCSDRPSPSMRLCSTRSSHATAATQRRTAPAGGPHGDHRHHNTRSTVQPTHTLTQHVSLLSSH